MEKRRDFLKQMVFELNSLLRNLVFVPVAGAVLSALTVAAVAAPPLVSHRATYDLSLHDTGNDSHISDITGRMVFEMRGSECEGYSISYRFVTEMITMDGGGELTDLRSTSFEEPEGASYSFLVKTFVGDREEKTVRGVAVRDANRIDVSVQKPEGAATVFSGETIFPTQHLRKIIAAAENGQTLVFADVYDGSEDGVVIYPTTAIIGKQRASSEITGNGGSADLPGSRQGWPVTLSYFEDVSGSAGEQTPIYAMRFFLFENGVSTDLILDYGVFAMKGKLRDLEYLESSACEE